MSANEEKKKFVIRHTFIDVKNKELYTDFYGKIERHFHVPWLASIYTMGNAVHICLECSNEEEEYDDEWMIETAIETKVFTKDGEKRFETKKSFNSNEEYSTFYIEQINPLDEYLVDGNLTVEYHVTIDKMTGIEMPILGSFDNKPARELSDVVLKVKEQKFYVNKMYLAVHSTYFKSLFLGNFNESKQSEVELKDIDPYDFQKFLEVLYASPEIKDDTVEGILKLADMYDSKVVIQQCEKFLIKESTQNLKGKFLMAVQYKLEKLKKKCLSEFETPEDITAVIPEDPSQLDYAVWKELLNLSFDFYRTLAQK